jgi:hypothetical protein
MRTVLPTIAMFAFSILIPITTQAQWQQSQSCHINARTGDSRFAGRADVIDATFKWTVVQYGGSYNCTGVLMNRRVDQDDLGFYFSTARHCLHDPDFDLGVPDIDLNADHTFMFHYQSPSGSTDQTEPSNQGLSGEASTSLNSSGYEYHHISKVELIKETITGDYALLRMVTPPPPHFNLYFAGWNPKGTGIPPTIITPGGGVVWPCSQWHGFVLPNHPKGDIKKINGAAALRDPTGLVFLGCNTITTVIDFLFGWIWGNTSSTQVICSYVSYPWYTVEWCDHGTEKGSSGAPLFNPWDKYIGPLSWLGNPCSGWVPTNIGKFKNAYPFAAVRNTLNPSYDWTTNQFGMDGRRIACYTNLDLPGGHQTPSYYFPARHYQSENRIALRAQQHINVVAPITILEGAHYEFLAGESVVLSGLVDVHPGATFVAAIEGCTKSMESSPSNFSPTFVRLPKKLTMGVVAKEEGSEVLSTAPFLTVFPNPAHTMVQFRTDMHGPWRVELYGPLGTRIRDEFLHDANMGLSGIAAGLYHLRISNAEGENRKGKLPANYLP